MKHSHSRLYLTLLLLVEVVLAKAQQPEELLKDAIYNPKIATVLLYPNIEEPDNPKRLISPPITSVQNTKGLMLEFDDLSAQYDRYSAKILHCNADWSKSNLNDIEFTYEYNDYPILDQQQSFSTKIPYFHYSFQIPRLKLSGNYVVVVYDQDRKPVLSRKFMLYDLRVNISAEARFSQGIQQQFSDQQIDFKIDYSGLNLVAPQTDLKVIMRKNFRWDQAKMGFKPSHVRPFDKQLEYTFFDLENTFPGGNEFRYFDSRTLSGRGYGIEQMVRSPDHTTLLLFADKPRNDNGYLQIDDLNGQYVVDQRESGRGSTDADYTPVRFSLKMAEVPHAEVYVNGGFHLWNLNELNKMTYNPDTGSYEVEMLIKQGVVNYDYVLVPANGQPDETWVEGDYATTENDYDLLVYYRAPAGRSDLLIGYRTVEWNRRR
ncbi:uncharacterized protein DUF5103 [Dyadobacter jejuensis]|uniref:Uncharacterized protein DUF5103 n=1 Tax=Dyadobacter jejuensis TaxID=1082580 RepID=A0A316ASC8_9BACT|nr:DUF5103 domain-containing protein [Dyadobacter jejuensis]PWJ60595.1 uncharacterized protein DUF5103 [Dyadobacter jejuensis]